MKARLLILAVALVIVAFAVGRISWADAQPSAPPKIVWQYKDAANLTVEQMNAFGAEGWDLCAMTMYGKDLYYVFKRAR